MGLSHGPLFIVGMPRSGTTLVSMVCSGHSQIAIAPETHYFEKFYRPAERRGFRETADHYARHVHAFLDSPEVAAFGFSGPERQELRRTVLSDDRRSHRSVLLPVLSLYARKQGKSRMGEKTPGHADHLDALIREFPDARVLWVVRDPRDVALSLGKVAWRKGNLVQHARDWARSAERLERHRAALGDRLHVLRYEDLLRDPTAAARGICRFMDVPFEPSMLDYPDRVEPNFDVAAEPWKARSLQRIDPDNAERWRAEMPARDRAIVDRLAGDEMVALGYPPSGEPLGPAGMARLGWLMAGNAVLLVGHWARRARLRLAGP